MKKDLISIVVPCFNVEKFLPDLFASLDGQTIKNFEVVFVDDFSTDNTIKLIEDFCNARTNCKLIKQDKNSGVSATRNVGLANCDGEYVLFVDSDDMLAPNFLECLFNTIQDCDMAVCGEKQVAHEKRYDQVKFKQKKRAKKLYFNSTNEILAQFLSTKYLLNGIHNKLFKMSALEKIETFPKVFDETMIISEDSLFCTNYICQINKAIYVNDKLYLYRLRRGGLTRSEINEKKIEAKKGVDLIIKLCEEKYPDCVKYAIGFKCVLFVNRLFRIAKSNYENKAVVKEFYDFLKQNIHVFKKGKRNPLYRKWFMWTVLPYFKIVLRKKM